MIQKILACAEATLELRRSNTKLQNLVNPKSDPSNRLVLHFRRPMGRSPPWVWWHYLSTASLAKAALVTGILLVALLVMVVTAGAEEIWCWCLLGTFIAYCSDTAHLRQSTFKLGNNTVRYCSRREAHREQQTSTP